MRQLLTNANIVLPDTVMEGGCLLLEDGVIAAMGSSSAPYDTCIDLTGHYLIPGLIDLHCDVIEKDVEMRPNVHFPMDLAVTIADRRCAVSGITTQYHGISFGHEKRGLRDTKLAEQLARAIHAFQRRGWIDHRILLRYEIPDPDSADTICRLLDDDIGDMVSFMDHSRGNSLYADVVRRHIGGEALDNERTPLADAAYRRMERIASGCKRKQIPLGSHDDKNPQRIQLIHKLGVSLCEFPFDMATAAAGIEKGMAMILGAPNAVRGKSHLNWLCAREAVQKGLAQCLCSDYHPTILPHAIFTLVEHGIATLPKAVSLATQGPAQAAGLTDRGRIVEGKRADLVALTLQNHRPNITRCWVKGEEIFRCGKEIND